MARPAGAAFPRHRASASRLGSLGAAGLVSSVDDLAYLYLDLSKQLDLKDAVLVGNCFGGWIAAEMAVRDTRRFAKLVLAAPLGQVRRPP